MPARASPAITSGVTASRASSPTTMTTVAGWSKAWRQPNRRSTVAGVMGSVPELGGDAREPAAGRHDAAGEDDGEDDRRQADGLLPGFGGEARVDRGDGDEK